MPASPTLPWDTPLPLELSSARQRDRISILVLKGSRLFAGKSYLQAVLAVTEAITLGVDVMVLGGSEAQAQRVMRYITTLWSLPGAPRDLLLAEPSRSRVRLTSGNVIEAVPASARAVRGAHPVRLHLDEVDEMPIGIFDAAMGLTLTFTPPNAVVPTQPCRPRSDELRRK